MGGEMPFRDALSARLKLIKPSERDLREYLAKNPPRLAPNAEKLVAKLQRKGVHVYLVTGGFRQVCT